MKAVKGNKVYTIEERQKKQYQENGYDILDDGGAVIAYARGKTVSYEQYQKVVDELNKLKASGTEGAGKAKEDELCSMTADELRAYAETNGISIGNSTSQQGILKKIREAGKGKEQ